MFDDCRDELVVVRSDTEGSAGHRLLWWAGARVSMARQHCWWDVPCDREDWMPHPRHTSNRSLSGLVTCWYLPAMLSLVSVGWMASWVGAAGGILAVLFATLATVLLVAGPRRFREYRRTLPTSANGHDRQQLRKAGQSADQILQTWPQLGELGAGTDPRPVLETSLWDLAGVIDTRVRTRDTRDKLARFALQLPDGHSLREQVDARRTSLDQRLGTLDDDIETRVAALSSLAGLCRTFIAEQSKLATARDLLRDADEILGATTPAGIPVDDPISGLAERTTAILAAYQELSAPLPHARAA